MISFSIAQRWPAASAVRAQAPADQAPEDSPWLTQAAIVLLGGFVIAVSMKKSKREHRD